MAAVSSIPVPEVHARAATAVASVSLRDDEISIGPALPEDLGALFVWLNDVEASRLDVTYRPIDAETYRRWLDQLAQNSAQVLFTIRKHGSPRPVGFVLLRNIHAVHRSAEIGMRIGDASERGRGYGGRSLKLALRYAWNTLNLERVSLTAFAHNTRAIASYRRAGFVEEGLMRHASFIDGKWVDVVMMAALRPGLGA